MTWILNIESTTNRGSVSLTKKGSLIELITSDEATNFSENITIFIQSLLLNNAITVRDLSAVAFSMGPGSYTSLRIGLSVAKAMCFGRGIPLIGISTLELLANESIHRSNDKNAIYLAMIDARRMDIYCEIFNYNMEILLPQSFVTLNEEWFDQWSGKTCILSGDGSLKAKNLSLQKGIVLFHDLVQSADLMTSISYQYFLEQKFIDLANSTPNYLKPPNITTQKHIIN